MTVAVAEVGRLRAELETRFGRAIQPGSGSAREAAEGFRTGLAAIDGLLPGGVSRGALTLWLGATETTGRTAALRALVQRACAEGATVGLVDAGLTLDPTFGCAGSEWIEGFWIVRPPAEGRRVEAAWAAEALLRTGAFDLVVLDGHIPSAPEAHRLRLLVRERGTALLITAAEAVGSTVVSDVRLEFRRASRWRGLGPGGRFRRRARIGLIKGGLAAGPRERELELVHEPTDRLRPGPATRDRSPGGR